MKKYIATAGIRVKCYKTLFSNHKTNKAKIDCLAKLLEENGVKGRPTLEKCKKAKAAKLRKQEVEALDQSKILSEGI